MKKRKEKKFRIHIKCEFIEDEKKLLKNIDR
jgi:hypothetical protein